MHHESTRQSGSWLDNMAARVGDVIGESQDRRWERQRRAAGTPDAHQVIGDDLADRGRGDEAFWHWRQAGLLEELADQRHRERTEW